MIDKFKLAKKYMSRKGFGYLSDDFGQFVCLEELRGRKTIMKFHYIEFMRAQKHLFKEVPFYKDPIVVEERSLESEIATLKWIPRAIIILLNWGYSQKEIAYVFGVSEGMLSQIYTKTKKELRGE